MFNIQKYKLNKYDEYIENNTLFIDTFAKQNYSHTVSNQINKNKEITKITNLIHNKLFELHIKLNKLSRNHLFIKKFIDKADNFNKNAVIRNRKYLQKKRELLKQSNEHIITPTNTKNENMCLQNTTTTTLTPTLTPTLTSTLTPTTKKDIDDESAFVDILSYKF